MNRSAHSSKTFHPKKKKKTHTPGYHKSKSPFHIPCSSSQIINAATIPAIPIIKPNPLPNAADTPFPSPVCRTVASPGANITGTLKSADSRICSGVIISLSSSSHDGLASLAGMLLVTEMGRSKMV